MFLTVAIATAGRREAVSDLLSHLSRQTRLPDLVAICPASSDDVDQNDCHNAPFTVAVFTGPRGLTSQRNLLIRSTTHSDIVLFFDDDFVPAPSFLSQCEEVFSRNSDVVMVTGRVLADGILGPGLTLAEAEAYLAADDADAGCNLIEVYNGYGCNMAIRGAVVRQQKLWFDETLPFYGWLEDVDFSRGLAKFGRIVKADGCRGVHRGVKRGRSSGIRLGYSQIANPIYLARKKRMGAVRAMGQLTRNVGQNIARFLRPEPWVDRKGRLAGNLIAVKDLFAGKLDPAKIVQLP